MWCFFDESYPREGGVTAVVACLMHDETVRHLDSVQFKAKKKYLGRDHARDLNKELKGSKLLSNQSFNMVTRYGFSKNHHVAQEILSECKKHSDKHPILVFGAAVYGAQDILKKTQQDKVSLPLADVLKRVSVAAAESSGSRRVTLVFDEQLAELDVAISLRRFISGMKIANVSHYPLVGVSHVSPGIQLADIGAYILGRRAVGDHRFRIWLEHLRGLEWHGKVDGYNRRGIQRWDYSASGRITVRKKWE